MFFSIEKDVDRLDYSPKITKLVWIKHAYLAGVSSSIACLVVFKIAMTVILSGCVLVLFI